MKCILDTNVPVKASYAVTEYKDEELELIDACIKFIHDFINCAESKLVLDLDWEILNEYKRNIKTTAMGNEFLKWVDAYIGRADFSKDIIKLEKKGNDYLAFPENSELDSFDFADRKFVALAMSHDEKPDIIQAADGKWLEYVEKLKEYGIHIKFLNQDYAERKYKKKILDKRQ